MGTIGAYTRRSQGFLAGALVIGSALVACTAHADVPAYESGRGLPVDRTPSSAPARHKTFGMSMDIGVPDGAGLALVVRPKFDWLRLGGAFTYNGMAPGARVGVTLDPVSFPLAPTLTVEGGHYWAGTVPGVQGSPVVGYDYANLHFGLEVGSRANFRFFLRGGASWLALSATHLSSGGSGIGDPSFTGWLAPTGKLGFAAFF